MGTIQNLEKKHIVLKTRFLGKKAIWPVDRQTDRLKKEKKQSKSEVLYFLTSAYDQEAVQKQGKPFQGYRSFILWSKSGPRLHFCVYFCLVGSVKHMTSLWLQMIIIVIAYIFLKSKKGKNLLFFI